MSTIAITFPTFLLNGTRSRAVFFREHDKPNRKHFAINSQENNIFAIADDSVLREIRRQACHSVASGSLTRFHSDSDPIVHKLRGLHGSNVNLADQMAFPYVSVRHGGLIALYHKGFSRSLSAQCLCYP